ncbi:MAG: endonuclease domain-containing protein [Candidatus Peribacteria bacterium]|nr:endonuclease domain-containing protein [Candidatus Peribacteria bacterium]
MRFTNSDIYNNFDGVCETIEEKIRNRENPPNPLYQGGNREIPLTPFIKGGYSYL